MTDDRCACGDKVGHIESCEFRKPTDDAIPAFLRLTPEERRAAWEAQPKPIGNAYDPVGYQQTETEKLYWESVAADKAKQRLKDEARWKLLREKKEAEKAERAAVWSKRK